MHSPWLRRFPVPSHDGTRLVCFPHAGGSASYYFPLARQLAPEVTAWAVQYPGRQERRQEPCLTRLSDIADAAYEALRQHLVEPYAFFGHSMGALLAFEVAHRFERSGTGGPVHVFASARRAPCHIAPSGPADGRPMTDDELMAGIRRLGGTAPDVLDDEDLRAMVLPVVRADYQAVGTYTCAPSTSLHCPLTVLVGDRDPEVTVAEAAAWRHRTTREFDISVYSGGHFYLDRHLPVVARDIIAALTRSPRVGTRPAQD